MKFKLRIAGLALVLPLLFALTFVSCKTSKTLSENTIVPDTYPAETIDETIESESGSNTAEAIFGAAIGGPAGAAIGNYMDKQTRELEENVAGAKIERVGEGIKITFDSGTLFGFGSSELSSKAQVNVSKMVKILNKYKDTDIIIEGHTDNKGSDIYNLKLSEERANEIAKLLRILSVDTSRVSEAGYGEEKPVADNGTEAGRSLNRRVEVAIYANEKLKIAAQKGSLSIP
jgi:outer membrane protein OmpA-like peptidoglycan-associated protein